MNPATRPRSAVVVGAGVAGLVTSAALAARGWQVGVIASEQAAACSPMAGGMLAPACELDAAEPPIVRLGLDSVARWRRLLPSSAMLATGSLVVAHRPEQPLLDQLADRVRRAGLAERLTVLDREGLRRHEGFLADRFHRGLLLAREGVVHPRSALPFLRRALEDRGVAFQSGHAREVSAHAVRLADGSLSADVVVDARGLGARADLPLRGVRGEFALVHAPEVTLSRPVRVAHPRYPLYVVPRPDGRFYLGATSVERDDRAPATVRSTLELLSAAFSVHPAFADGEVEELGVGLRPATPDHAPWIVHRPGLVHLNGLFRHGWLLAPRLAAAVVDLLDDAPVGDDIAPFVKEAA